MINQAIGNGIFTSPAYVLSLTKSKLLSIGLWALGGVYSFLSEMQPSASSANSLANETYYYTTAR